MDMAREEKTKTTTFRPQQPSDFKSVQTKKRDKIIKQKELKLIWDPIGKRIYL